VFVCVIVSMFGVRTVKLKSEICEGNLWEKIPSVAVAILMFTLFICLSTFRLSLAGRLYYLLKTVYVAPV